MSYIGNTSTTQAFTPAVDFFNGNGSTTAFTLSRPVASVAQVQAVISNVPQNPGTAYTVSGNTITFTSAPPSGTQNIYVYYTSPITQVIAPGQGTVTTTSLSQGGPSWDTSGNVTLTGNIRLNNGTADGAQVSLASSGYSDWNIDNYSGNFRWYYNATEYMRLDASGNLGVGTTSPESIANYSILDVGSSSSKQGYIQAGDGTTKTVMWTSGGVGKIGTRTVHPLTFQINSSEVARIDTSGNLLVGTTSNTSNAERGLFAASNSLQLAVQSTNTNGAQVRFYEGSTLKTMIGGIASTNAFQVQCGGSGGVSLANGGTSWTALSDERKKDIIEPITNGLQKVSSLRAVIGKYKNDEEGTRRSFLIAQDVQAVLPEAVIETTESIGSTETVLALSYTDVIPLLVAAIQEQQAIIETLTNRITALENK